MPTPGRSRKAVRMDDDPWDRFGEAAAKLGYDRSEVIRDFIEWFVDQPDRVTYRRPEPSPKPKTVTFRRTASRRAGS